MIYCFHMKKQYIIKLSKKERSILRSVIKKGTNNARTIHRARVLMASNGGAADAAIADQEDVHWTTVRNIRKRYHEGGLHRAISDAERSGHPRVLSDGQEAHLVAIACSDPPAGSAHWTLDLIRERLSADGIAHDISRSAIHARLTERGIQPWREKNVVYPDRQ